MFGRGPTAMIVIRSWEVMTVSIRAWTPSLMDLPRIRGKVIALGPSGLPMAALVLADADADLDIRPAHGL